MWRIIFAIIPAFHVLCIQTAQQPGTPSQILSASSAERRRDLEAKWSHDVGLFISAAESGRFSYLS